MKWLTVNGTTIAMALVLSLLTIGLLTKPDLEKEVEPVILNARFLPDVKAEVGSIEFWVGDKKYTDTIPVTVTGDLEQIRVISLTCQPLLDKSKFPEDQEVRETEVEITHKDFNLPSDLAKRILIKEFQLRITYAPMINKVLPVDVSDDIIVDAKEAGVRINSIRAMPPEISVRLPVDKVNTLKAVKIRPIRVAGRTTYFETEGRINRELPDFKDVSTRETFTIAIDLSVLPFQAKVEGVPLHLSYSPIAGLQADLIDRMDYKIVVEGPQSLVERVKPDQLHVYVKLDLTPETQPGAYTLPVRCDLADESLRKLVRVYLAPGEAVMAAVQVIK